MCLLSNGQIYPKLDHGPNQLVPFRRHQLSSILPNLLDVVPNIQIGNVGNLLQRLYSILLYHLIIDLNGFTDAVHDEFPLSIQLEVLCSHGDSPAESLHRYLGSFRLLTIDVADGGMQNLANLLI